MTSLRIHFIEAIDAYHLATRRGHSTRTLQRQDAINPPAGVLHYAVSIFNYQTEHQTDACRSNVLPICASGRARKFLFCFQNPLLRQGVVCCVRDDDNTEVLRQLAFACCLLNPFLRQDVSPCSEG